MVCRLLRIGPAVGRGSVCGVDPDCAGKPGEHEGKFCQKQQDDETGRQAEGFETVQKQKRHMPITGYITGRCGAGYASGAGARSAQSGVVAGKAGPEPWALPVPFPCGAGGLSHA